MGQANCACVKTVIHDQQIESDKRLRVSRKECEDEEFKLLRSIIKI